MKKLLAVMLAFLIVTMALPLSGAFAITENVITEDFCEVWRTKACDVWSRPEVLKYIDSWEDEEEINHGLRNYFDADVRL